MAVQQLFQGKNIVVTGASSGIGGRLAWYIAQNGGIPIMIARSLAKLEEQKEQIWHSFQVTSHVYQADIMDADAYQTTIINILNDHKQIHGLINNAGAGVFADVDALQWNDMTHMFQLNVYALINGTKLMLPHFLENRQICHIVNIASMAGKVATPKSSVYAATKHAVVGFSNALRMEVAKNNIYVTAVNLGPVKTPFFETADPDGSYQKNVSRYMLDPDKVAKSIVKHLFRKKREINLPGWMAVGAKLYQLIPGLVERVLRKSFDKK